MKILRSIMVFSALVVLWQMLIYLFQLPPYILPAPMAVGKNLISYGRLITQEALITFTEAFIGLSLSIIFGSFAALFLTYFSKTAKWFLPILLASQAIPTFAIAPLFVIWFGYALTSKIATIVLMLFFPITSSFYDGLSRTPLSYLDLAKVMQASKFNTLWRIQMPAALPALASGVRVAAVFAPMGAVIGEWVGSVKGLGFLILNANSRMQIDLMFAALFVLIITTLLFYFAIDYVLKKLIYWK